MTPSEPDDKLNKKGPQLGRGELGTARKLLLHGDETTGAAGLEPAVDEPPAEPATLVTT